MHLLSFRLGVRRLICGAVILAIVVGMLPAVVDFRRLLSAAVADDISPSLGDGLVYSPSQFRLADTRTGNGGYATPMAANTWRTFQVVGRGGIPASAKALQVSLIAISPNVPGTVDVSSTDLGSAITSALSYGYGNSANVENTTVIQIGLNGMVRIRSTAAIELVVEVQGYFSPTVGMTTGGYFPIDTVSAVDTRYGIGAPKAKLSSTGTINVIDVSGWSTPPVAAFVNIVVLNTHATSATGYLRVAPTGAPNQAVSLQYGAGVNTALGSVVALNASGQFSITMIPYVSTASVDIAVQILGLYQSPRSTDDPGGFYTPSSGHRVNVKNSAAIAAGEQVDVQLNGIAGIPVWDGSYIAFAGMLQVKNTSSDSSYVRMWKEGADEPSTSVAHIGPTSSRSHYAIIPVSENGKVTVKNMGAAPVTIYFDVQGWYNAPGYELGDPGDDETIFDDLDEEDLIEFDPDLGVPELEMQSALDQDVTLLTNETDQAVPLSDAAVSGVQETTAQGDSADQEACSISGAGELESTTCIQTLTVGGPTVEDKLAIIQAANSASASDGAQPLMGATTAAIKSPGDVAVPESCAHQANGSGWKGKRLTSQCRSDGYVFSVLDAKRVKIVGSFIFQSMTYMYTNKDFGYGAFGVVTVGAFTNFTGVATQPGTYLVPEFSCSGSCAVAPIQNGSQVVSDKAFFRSSALFQSNLSARTKASKKPKTMLKHVAKMTFTAKRLLPYTLAGGVQLIQVAAVSAVASNTVNCDTHEYRVVCSYPGVAAVMDYKQSGTIAPVTAHIKKAFNSGIRGQYGSGFPLHKQEDTTAISNNRSVSCPYTRISKAQRDNDLGCDEFPLATTQEGANRPAYKNTGGRTFTGCDLPETSIVKKGRTGDGWSVCAVPKKANSAQGQVVAHANKYQHINNGDTYYIRIV